MPACLKSLIHAKEAPRNGLKSSRCLGVCSPEASAASFAAVCSLVAQCDALEPRLKGEGVYVSWVGVPSCPLQHSGTKFVGDIYIYSIYNCVS